MTDISKTPSKNTKNLKDDLLTVPASPCLQRLGYGTGVSVYKFERSPRSNSVRSPWALKVNSKKQPLYGKRLREEACILRKLKHPNIVGFRAFTMTSSGKECLAMEECTISLADLIEKRSEELQVSFPADKILKFAYDISKALDYLHGNVLLLHGDIKSHNVLVKGDFDICKLCDFGVSLPLTKNGELNRKKVGEDAEYVGTICWSAPEVLQTPQQITTKADIFAFGLVIWETIALNIPHYQVHSEESIDLENSLTETPELFGTRPALPYHMFEKNLADYNHVLEIFHCCTEIDPNKRLSAHQLTLLISEMINN